MQPLMNDATTALLRAIRLKFPDCRFALEEVRSRSWASVTFVGARHELAFRLEGDRAAESGGRFLANLESAEFDLRDHLLADIALVDREELPGALRIRIEALTVEDG